MAVNCLEPAAQPAFAEGGAIMAFETLAAEVRRG